jgi:DNA-directed RNA polymerase subunit RPC12/RpoP
MDDLSLIRCYRCGEPVNDTAKACPLCGAKIKIKPKSLFTEKAVWVLWLSLVANVVQFAIAEKRQIAEAARVADMSGAQTFAEACTICHRKDHRPLNNLHLTKAQWKEAIERMEDYRRGVPEAKRPALLDYLVAITSAAPGPTLLDYWVAMTSAAPGPAKQ